MILSQQTVTGSNIFAEDQVFNKDIKVTDDLWVSGAMKVGKPSAFDNTLSVAEDGTFSKDLYIADDIWVSGGMRIAKPAVFDSSVTIVSDLTVNGTTTTINTTNLKVKDKIVIIGSGSASADSQGGIAIISGSSSTNKALVIGRIANDTWGVGKQDVQDGAVTSLTGMSLVNMRASKYEIDGATNYLDVDTDLKIVAAADITLDPGGGDINADGNILPNADNTRDLGSASKRWANIYTGDLHLRNDKGDWTIVEESDMLIVRNNLTGKSYKMMLEPIEESE